MVIEQMRLGELGRDMKPVIADEDKERVLVPGFGFRLCHELPDAPVGVAHAVEALVHVALILSVLEGQRLRQIEGDVI